MDYLKKQIGEFIKKYRLKSSISIKEATEILNIDIQAIESGKKGLPQYKIIEIQKLYKIPPEEIIKFKIDLAQKAIQRFN